MATIKPPRPCICGAPSTLVKVGKTWQIGCTDPKCALIVSGFKKREEAVTAWEKRLKEVQSKESQTKKETKRRKKRGN